MAMSKTNKNLEIENISGFLSEAGATLCADYRGLSVDVMTSLRSDIRKAGGTSRVVKNTLARRSIETAFSSAAEEERARFAELFEGPSFLIFSGEDPVAPAKVLAKFAKDHEDLELKGGWFEDGFLDVNGIKDLSNLPSREELYAKLLSLMQAPATKLVQLLSAPATKIAQTLEAHRGNLEKKGE